MSKLIALFSLITILCVSIAAQDQIQGGKSQQKDFTVRVDTSLVNVPIAVLTRDGKFISNLRRDNFRVFEDGVEQEITHFKDTDEPFTVVLLLDISDSAKIKFQEIKDSAIAFLDQLRSQDRALIVTFDAKATVIIKATSSKNDLRTAINRIQSGSGTSVYDAVEMTFREQLNKIQGRKAIVMFSDGVDQHSHQATSESTLALAEEQDAPVYIIRYDTYEEGTRLQIPGVRNMASIEIREGPTKKDYELAQQYLHALSDVSGGRYYYADKPANLNQSFARIAEELRHQYVIGYYPTNLAATKKRREIKVKVDAPNSVIRSRRNYVYKTSTDNSTKP